MTISTEIEAPFVGTEIDGSGAQSDSPDKPKAAVCIGFRKSTGAVLEAVPFLVTSDEVADLAADRRSMLADMLRNFRKANPTTELWGIAINEPSGGTAGTQTITPVGTATAAGTIIFRVGGYRISVDVAVGDDPTAIAASIAAAFQLADNAGLPGTTAAASGVATFTNSHKGAYEVKITVGGYPGETLPAGVSAVNIAAGATAAGAMTITTATDVLGSRAYDRVVLGMHSDTILDSVEATLAARWGANVELDGIAVCAHIGASLSTITTYTAAPARNSPYSVVVAGPDTAFQAPAWRVAAIVAGLDLSEALCNTPRSGLVLPGIQPGTGTQFDLAQRSILIKAGASTLRVDAGGNVVIDRLVTTYQKNGAGAVDKLFQNVGTMAAIAYLRWLWRNRILLKYPRHLLGDDGAQAAPGVPLVTPSTMRAEAAAMHKEASDLGLLDSSTLAAFLEALSVTRPTGDNNRLNVIMSPVFLAQFLKLATTLRPQL